MEQLEYAIIPAGWIFLILGSGWIVLKTNSLSGRAKI